MQKQDVDRLFAVALASVAESYGRGFNTHVVEKLPPNISIAPSYIASIKKSNKTTYEEKRRAIVEATNRLMGTNYTYQEFLDLGAWILDGKNPDEWENYLKKIKQEIFSQLNHNLDQIESVTEGLRKKKQSYIIPILKKLPVISFVQAGEWHEAIDNFQPGDAEEWISTTSKLGKRAFALKVVGKSMEPEFREGEYISIDPDAQVESGDFVIAKNGDEEATFKQYYKDGSKHLLVPLNEAWGKPMDMTEKEWRIIGRVMEKVKKY